MLGSLMGLQHEPDTHLVKAATANWLMVTDPSLNIYCRPKMPLTWYTLATKDLR